MQGPAQSEQERGRRPPSPGEAAPSSPRHSGLTVTHRFPERLLLSNWSYNTLDTTRQSGCASPRITARGGKDRESVDGGLSRPSRRPRRGGWAPGRNGSRNVSGTQVGKELKTGLSPGGPHPQGSLGSSWSGVRGRTRGRAGYCHYPPAHSPRTSVLRAYT